MNLSPHDIEIIAITLLILFLDAVVRGFLKGLGLPPAVNFLYPIAALAGLIWVLSWAWQHREQEHLAVTPSPTSESQDNSTKLEDAKYNDIMAAAYDDAVAWSQGLRYPIEDTNAVLREGMGRASVKGLSGLKQTLYAAEFTKTVRFVEGSTGKGWRWINAECSDGAYPKLNLNVHLNTAKLSDTVDKRMCETEWKEIQRECASNKLLKGTRFEKISYGNPYDLSVCITMPDGTSREFYYLQGFYDWLAGLEPLPEVTSGVGWFADGPAP
jgi:hypothetical protein